MEAREEVEVEPDGVEEVAADQGSSLVAAVRGCLPSINASQSFSAQSRSQQVANFENPNAR